MTYIDSCYTHDQWDAEPHNWRTFTHLRLAFIYGDVRADRIMSGQDPKTQMDISAWSRLGRRDAA